MLFDTFIKLFSSLGVEKTLVPLNLLGADCIVIIENAVNGSSLASENKFKKNSDIYWL